MTVLIKLIRLCWFWSSIGYQILLALAPTGCPRLARLYWLPWLASLDINFISLLLLLLPPSGAQSCPSYDPHLANMMLGGAGGITSKSTRARGGGAGGAVYRLAVYTGLRYRARTGRGLLVQFISKYCNCPVVNWLLNCQGAPSVDSDLN